MHSISPNSFLAEFIEWPSRSQQKSPPQLMIVGSQLGPKDKLCVCVYVQIVKLCI